MKNYIKPNGEFDHEQYLDDYGKKCHSEVVQFLNFMKLIVILATVGFLFIVASGCKVIPSAPEVQTETLLFKSIPDTMTAIDVLTTNTWTDPEGFNHIGGLYPDGLNVPPLNHAQKIQKANNKLGGTIGFLSLGASNCMYESQEFANKTFPP